MRCDRDVIEQAAAEHGWDPVNDPISTNIIGRGEMQIHLGYSPTGRVLQRATHYVGSWRGRKISDTQPFRIAPRVGCLEVTLSWIRTGELDPPNPRRTPVIVIPCCANKREAAAPAEQLYDSDHFRFTLRVARAHVQKIGGKVLILSAKHGLLRLGDVIAPYDVTFGDVDAAPVDLVYRQLCVLGIGQVETLLPRRYLAVVTEAVQRLHRAGQVMRLTDLYAGAAGIGYQRGVLARLLQGSVQDGVAVTDLQGSA